MRHSLGSRASTAVGLRLVAVLCVGLALHPGVAHAKVGGCTLQVDGRTYLDGPCNIDLESGGSFSIGTGNDRTRSRYFAYVAVEKDAGTAEGSWNGADPRSTHAHSPLGALRREGACWVNERARVCARAAP